MTTAAPDTLLSLRQMIDGKWVSMAISVAAELGVADVLASGPRSSEEIARAVKAHEDGIYRLLRALTVVGVFAELAGRRFALTPLGEYLKTDHPASQRGFARFMGEDGAWRGWGALAHGVRTGEPVFRHAFGMSYWEYLAKNPEAAEIFNQAMTGVSAVESEAVASDFDFSGIRRIADVAGGHGLLLATILEKNPRLEGVLFEVPVAAEGARQLFRSRGLADRCEIVSGDFFAAIPHGCDAYLMKHVLHDWDDERSTRILANVRRAMGANGRVLVVDIVIPGPGEAHFGKILDLEMMALTEQGRERTREEFETLFRNAGLRLSRVVPTRAPVSVLEGLPD
jgi:C-methyltransferase